MLKYYISKWKKLGNRFYKYRSSHAKRLIQRTKLLGLIGSKCWICGSDKNLRFHETHGKSHEDKFSYILNHKVDFITLCQKHHSMLHLCNRAENLIPIQKKRLFRLLSIIQ